MEGVQVGIVQLAKQNWVSITELGTATAVKKTAVKNTKKTHRNNKISRKTTYLTSLDLLITYPCNDMCSVLMGIITFYNVED